MIQTQLNKKIKMIRTDNNTEFTCLSSYFPNNDMIHQTSIMATSQKWEG